MVPFVFYLFCYLLLQMIVDSEQCEYIIDDYLINKVLHSTVSVFMYHKPIKLIITIPAYPHFSRIVIGITLAIVRYKKKIFWYRRLERTDFILFASCFSWRWI